MQIAAMPRLPPVRSSVSSTCRAMRAPDAPTGWPSAIAPPSALSFAGSIEPRAPDRPSSVRQYSSLSHARRQAITCAANASLISHVSRSSSASP